MNEGLRNDITRLLRQFTGVVEELRRDPAAMAEAKAMVLKAVVSHPPLIKSIAAHPAGRQLAADLLKKRKVTREPEYLNKIYEPGRGLIKWHD